MHRNPALGLVFPLVATATTIGVVVWTLRRTRDEGRRYGGQLVVSFVLAIVAAVLLFVNAFLMTQVLFPDYVEEVRAVQEEVLATQSAGASPEELAAQQKALDVMTSPTVQAATGAIATVVTTMVVALIAAIFIRKKD